MVVGGKEVLGEGRSLRLCGAWIGQAERVEDLCHGGSSPDVHVHTCILMDTAEDFLLLFLKTDFDLVSLLQIDADPALAHGEADLLDTHLQIEDGRQFFSNDQAAHLLPQAQRQGCILLGVAADEVGGQLPHLALGVEAHLFGSVAQRALVLALFEIVKAKVVERIAEAVLIEQRSSHHRVGDLALDLHAFTLQPAHVVHRIVEDEGAVLHRADFAQPAERHTRIEVAPVGVTDREVPCRTFDSDSDPDDVALACRPASARLFQIGITGFQVDCDQAFSGQIRVDLRHHPFGFVLILERHLSPSLTACRNRKAKRS